MLVMADKRLSDAAGRGRYQRMRRRFLANAKAQGATCWFCSNPLDFSVRHPDERAVEVHHMIPVAVDPSKEFDIGNLAAAHRLCNSTGCAAFAPDDADSNEAIGRLNDGFGIPSENWDVTLLNDYQG